MQSLFAIKRETQQAWTTTGRRIPVTILRAKDNVILANTETEHYLGFGKKEMKDVNKPETGNMKKAGLSFGVRMTRKIMGTLTDKNVGDAMVPSAVFTVGDIVKVTGTSKGMGFAGVMKRHGFHGGPKTHGQSDRARAPGASSSGTQLGRLFKGKRMTGRGGNKTVSVQNLQIVAINDETGEVWVKGVVPGAINGTVQIVRVAEGKFEGLFEKKAKVEEVAVEEVVSKVAEETTPVEVEAQKEEPKEEKVEEVKTETIEQPQEVVVEQKVEGVEEKKEEVKAE